MIGVTATALTARLMRVGGRCTKPAGTVSVHTVALPGAAIDLLRGLATGAPGDVAIFSTEIGWTYDVNQSFSRSRNSPFDGRTFRGGPVATVVGGKLVWRRDGA